MRVSDHRAVELILARREDRRPLVDVGGIDEIQHREMLYVQDFVPAFQAESALAVQEVRDVGLLEASLLRQTQASKFSSVDAFPERFAEIFLQNAEFHRRSITRLTRTLRFLIYVRHPSGN